MEAPPSSIPGAVEDAAAEEDGLAAVYLYRSAGRGRRTSISDVDVGVLFGDEVPGKQRELAASRIAAAVARFLRDRGNEVREVDVRDLEALPLSIRGRVVTEGRLVLSRDEVRRVRLEEVTRRRYYDFLPFERADTEEGLRKRFSDG